MEVLCDAAVDLKPPTLASLLTSDAGRLQRQRLGLVGEDWEEEVTFMAVFLSTSWDFLSRVWPAEVMCTGRFYFAGRAKVARANIAERK